MDESTAGVGQRIVVTGMAGSGKSTFSRALGVRTGLPVIHLDREYWKPGWVAPTAVEWREKQERLLATDRWIADGNYHETLRLRVERADTVVVLDTAWGRCFLRALTRGLLWSGGEMPDGCERSRWRQLRDEWAVAGRVWRKRRWEREVEDMIIARFGQHTVRHVIRSNREANGLVDAIFADGARADRP